MLIIAHYALNCAKSLSLMILKLKVQRPLSLHLFLPQLNKFYNRNSIILLHNQLDGLVDVFLIDFALTVFIDVVLQRDSFITLVFICHL